MKSLAMLVLLLFLGTASIAQPGPVEVDPGPPAPEVLPQVEAPASTTLAEYLAASEPLLSRRTALAVNFLANVEPLRRSRDLLGLQALLLRNDANQKGLREALDALQAPPEAASYHASLQRLLELELELNSLLGETTERGLQLTSEVLALEQNGPATEAVQARLNDFSAVQDELTAKVAELRSQAATLEQGLRAQRETLRLTTPTSP